MRGPSAAAIRAATRTTAAARRVRAVIRRSRPQSDPTPLPINTWSLGDLPQKEND